MGVLGVFLHFVGKIFKKSATQRGTNRPVCPGLRGLLGLELSGPKLGGGGGSQVTLSVKVSLAIPALPKVAVLFLFFFSIDFIVFF